MDISLSFTLGAFRSLAAGGVVGPPPPEPGALAVLPVVPAARWHPGHSVVTLEDGRVAMASDLMGLAPASQDVAASRPFAFGDGLGRLFWRFQNAHFLDVPVALATQLRDVSVFAVCREHRSDTSNAYFSLGNRAAGTNKTTNNSLLDTAQASSGAPFVRCASGLGSNEDPNVAWMISGSQLQVLGAVSRPTAEGGRRVWCNTRSRSISQISFNTSLQGAEIGRNAQSGSNYGRFDLYELVVFDRGLTDAEGDAVVAALTDHWGIAPVTHQIVLEGDSITQGVGPVGSGVSSGMVLSEPGAGLLPPGWRVVNMAVSGATAADLVTRRDTARSWSNYLLPGQNVMAFEIGRNGFSTNPASAIYDAVVAYLNTSGLGVLQKGWAVRVMANIAGAPSQMDKIIPYRALLRDSQYLVDTGSGPGEPFAGQVSVIPTDLIEDAGAPIFLTAANAASTTYYQGDNTHPSVLGTALRISGGDTPQYGLGWGL